MKLFDGYLTQSNENQDISVEQWNQYISKAVILGNDQNLLKSFLFFNQGNDWKIQDITYSL